MLWFDIKKSLGCVCCLYFNNGGFLIEDWEWRLIYIYYKFLENFEVDKVDLFFFNVYKYFRICMYFSVLD